MTHDITGHVTNGVIAGLPAMHGTFTVQIGDTGSDHVKLKTIGCFDGNRLVDAGPYAADNPLGAMLDSYAGQEVRVIVEQ
jgi:hypothetical protein